MGHPDGGVAPRGALVLRTIPADAASAVCSLRCSIVLCVQLMAGHFNLAFLTVLTLAAYVPLRLFFANRDLPAESRSSPNRCADFRWPLSPRPDSWQPSRSRRPGS